ncbi:MAG TPA: PKD domain-containing protein [Verrucomicrobiae bacterium]|nr:PKD domain-containing protein [Verrucomicrobiae bacterium]
MRKIIPPTALAAALFAVVGQIPAATPASGVIRPNARTLSYTFPFAAIANASGASEDTYTCNTGPTDPCDIFTLTVELPANFLTTNPNDFLRIEAAVTGGASDIDLQLASESGALLKSYRDNPPAQPFLEYPVTNGTTRYQIQVVPGSPHEGGDVTVTLVEGPPPPPPDADGDGVGDDVDECPDTPSGTSVDTRGCPLPEGEPESCLAPGLTVLVDPAADNTGSVPGTDLRSLQMYQPAQNPATGDRIEDQLLAFRLTVNAGAQPNPSNSWFVSFNAPGGVRGVRMTGDNAGTPIFQLYIPGANSAGTVDGRFVGGAQPADGSSSFDSASGVITIAVKATDLGLTAPGQELTAFNAGVTATTDVGGVGAGATSVIDGMPNNDLSRSTAAYVLHDNTICGRPQLQKVGPPKLASGLPPRFYDLQSPPGLADTAGEPTLGYNPASKASMFIASTEVDRVTYAENAAAIGVVDAAGNALPESCPAIWEDKSYVGAVNTLDPILETEQTTGRTFQSSLSGANSIFAFSDDDGETWIPGQAGPPNGGADHQTIGVGPWAPGAKPPSATEDYAVYYCSQSVAAAFCSRSDNGGISFGPGIVFRDTATDCNNTLGGLHGHVQVARNDGTVYVPFGNCGAKVGFGISNDSGVTWAVKTIPQSSAGDDPGLGVADDGTAYMCYAEGGGGKIFASVSQDKGNTWSGHYDLGAAVGVVHTVFATAVAGDGDRAACAFLGTSTPGNPEAEDFPGVWYPYVATTYDRGKTWHTVNVAPNDPVQGAGGICLSGTLCGTNRNLLDFNDIVIGDDGRVLFGYSDGCRGACVLKPSQNTYSDNAVIARQSGGRTLRAALDDLVGKQFNSAIPVKPAAACARADLSLRTTFETRVNWTEPDTGGSPILNYKVYRSTSPTGTFDLIGDAGPKTFFLDPTADEAVEEYYYKVVAENAKGAASASNVIELPITVPVVEDSCTLPGVTVATEPSAGACTGTGGGCTPQTDLQGLYAAELPSQPEHVFITMKVDSLDPAPSPGQYWFAMTKKRSGENFYVSMDTESGAPAFRYGTYTVDTVTTFTPQGTLADGSTFKTDGFIHLVVPRSLLGTISPGDVLSGLEARTRAGQSAAPSRDVIGPGDYTIRGTRICLPNTAPVAVLDATPQAGLGPLTVTFDGRASYDADTEVPDSVVNYIIDFGDGTGSSASGGATPVWTHTYDRIGLYNAKLRVTDSRAKGSDNVAQRVIDVRSVGVVTAESAGNNRLGGAVAPLSLLVLGLLALRRRRPRH